jgi:hypothetical protein
MVEGYRVPPLQEGDHELVTVASYSTAVEAEMARALLQDRGITAFARESASFNPLFNVAAGGAIVQVQTRDEPRARALLAHVAKTSTDDDGDSEGDVRCPRCELSYCFHEPALSGGGLLPFGVFSRKRWRCRKCLHVWDDPSAGPARMTPLDPDDPRPVFRLRRGRGGGGLVLGLVLGLLVGTLAKDAGAALPVGLLILLVFPLAGYGIGRSMSTDVCSAPSCRAALPAHVEECPMCKGLVSGRILGAHEHYSEAAEFRRDLVALKAADERKLLPAKKLKKKRPARPAEAKPAS